MSDQLLATDITVEEDSSSVTDNSTLDGFKSHEIKSGDYQAASSRKAMSKPSFKVRKFLSKR